MKSLRNFLVLAAVSAASFGFVFSGAPHAAADYSDPDFFVKLADQVVPSVVNISSLKLERNFAPQFGRPEDMFRQFFGPQFGFPSPRGSQPESMSLGTGFVIDPSGIILTNNHVVQGADEIKITFTESSSEKPTPGKVIARDQDLDIALIKVKTSRKLKALPLGDSASVRVGEYVAAVGNPFGQGHSFTHGIISAKGRIAPNIPLATYLQTDAPINPGNSGGPLIDLKGQVIGINNAIDARAQGIGFAIPINVVKNVLHDLETKGSIARGFMGVVVSDLNPELASELSVPKNTDAPLVVQVAPGGPAYRAGIRPYDLILEFNGKPVHSPAELTADVTAVPVGSAVPVKISRADRRIDFQVKIGKRPEPQDQS